MKIFLKAIFCAFIIIGIEANFIQNHYKSHSEENFLK
jgi:hypothetical protein